MHASHAFINNEIALGTHLFVKVPRPEDSKVTFSIFESSYMHRCYDKKKTTVCFFIIMYNVYEHTKFDFW